MEKARQSISSFISKDGKHRTTVDEDHRKAVTDEHIRPHRHEEIATVIDKEIHQDHHHTTVQPIKVSETLPEKHTHNMIPVEHKSYEHDNERDLRAALDRETAKYRDSSITHNATVTTTNAPTVSGEHIHHHVHEHVQPVIQKETIAPQVVHTTIPIHETHHAASVHHGTSILPAKTLHEFQTARGTLDGREKIQLSDFEGCPPTYNKDLQSEQLEADRHMHSHIHSHSTEGNFSSGRGENMMSGNRGMETSSRDSGYAGGRNEGLSSSRGEYTTGTTGTTGATGTLGTTGSTGRSEGFSGSRGEYLTGSNGRNEGMRENLTGSSGRNEGLSSSRGDNMTGQSGVQSQRFVAGTGGLVGGTGTTGTTGTGRTGNLGSDSRGDGSNIDTHDTNTSTGSGPTRKKASLVDKINPFKDSDGDGKKGFME